MGRLYRILMVDDEPDLEPLVLQRMRGKIRSGESSFVFAFNGVEVLEMLSRRTLVKGFTPPLLRVLAGNATTLPSSRSQGLIESVNPS